MTTLVNSGINSHALQKLLSRINMPADASDRVLDTFGRLNLPDLEPVEALRSKDLWDQGLKTLHSIFGEDPNGYKMLTCSLAAALLTKREYERLGIGASVFYDTMGCFSRFVREHHESFGEYGFDREWWTTRQLSALLFRLKILEFEMGEFHGFPSICIHIPSDASITEERCQDSYSLAREFFHRYFPSFRYGSITCSSWLLSPALRDVLKPGSNILKFQDHFKILKTDPDDKEFIHWVFKNDRLSITDYPCDTSLQRDIKQYMLEGHNIGSAEGELIQ